MLKKQAGRLFRALIGRNQQQAAPALSLAPPDVLHIFLYIPKTAGIRLLCGVQRLPTVRSLRTNDSRIVPLEELR